MKHYIALLFSIMTLAGLLSCADGEETEKTRKAEEIEIPASIPFRQITLTETIPNDNPPETQVTRKEEYFFSDKQQLVSHVTTQLFGRLGEYSMSHETTLTYTESEVTVTDAGGSVSVYTLNEQGYASRCTRREPSSEQTREYAFSYSDYTTYGAFLTRITETIQGEVTATIAFNFLPTSQATITLQNRSFSDTYHLGFGELNTSRLPLLLFTELHPLALHQEAMYAGLLGESPVQLIHTLTPANQTEGNTYTYTTDTNGNLSSCTISVQNDGNTHQRTVKYNLVLPT